MLWIQILCFYDLRSILGTFEAKFDVIEASRCTCKHDCIVTYYVHIVVDTAPASRSIKRFGVGKAMLHPSRQVRNQEFQFQQPPSIGSSPRQQVIRFFKHLKNILHNRNVICNHCHTQELTPPSDQSKAQCDLDHQRSHPNEAPF